MEETEEQKIAREAAEAEADGAGEGEGEGEPGGEKAPDRSIENLKAENERKAREIAELRARVDHATKGYDPNNMSTWDDRQLQALRVAPDVKAEFKAQADDILMDRRIERRMNAEREKDRREQFEVKRLAEFPETADPGHPMTQRMERIMKEMALDATPSGRYAAARLAASEMKPKKQNPKVQADQERERVAGIKASKTSADRPAAGADRPKYDDLLKKGARSDENFKQLLKAKSGGNGLRIPSVGL